MTTIEWSDQTWNPGRGCSLVSAGCTYCYAMGQAMRMSGAGGAYEGLVRPGPHGPLWTGVVREADERTLLAPLRWRKPRRVFVNSMSDLFHEGFNDDFLDRVFAVMALCLQHQFQVLTKRPERMRAYLGGLSETDRIADAMTNVEERAGVRLDIGYEMPFPNIWFGVSVEDQPSADERVPILLDTPAALRFVSAEPLLEAVDLTDLTTKPDLEDREGWSFRRDALTGFYAHKQGGWNTGRNLAWVIVGGESGPRSRTCNLEHVRSIVSQCRTAGVPVFVKQLGRRCRMNMGDSYGWPGSSPGIVTFKDRKGGDPAEWPVDLRVREMPDIVPESVGP